MNSTQIRSCNAVLTTLFTLEWEFVVDFFNSLNNQTHKDFEVLVVNDGFDKLDLIRDSYKDLNILEIEGVDCIAFNRQLLINTAKKYYDNAIFCDSDDFFSENRIELSIYLLNDYDVVVNDVDLYVNERVVNSSYFSQDLSNRAEITIDDIIEKNYFGLSNTAVKLSSIDNIEFDYSLKAVDWFFFSNLLIKERKAIFTNEAKTFYRQHSDNIAGIGVGTYDQIIKELDVKRLHYQLMSKINSNFESYLKSLNEFIAQAPIEPECNKAWQSTIEKSNAWWSLINLNLKWWKQ